MQEQFDEIKELIHDGNYAAALGRLMIYVLGAGSTYSDNLAEGIEKYFNQNKLDSLFNISGAGSYRLSEIVLLLRTYNDNKSHKIKDNIIELDVDFKLNEKDDKDNSIKLTKFINENGKEMTLIELDIKYLVKVLYDLSEKFYFEN